MTLVQDLSAEASRSVFFRSILFDEHEISGDIGGQQEPDFFTDLNLGQIVADITAGRDEYDLRPYFYTSLTRIDAINYRYDILRDLEDKTALGYVSAFAQGMRTVRAHTAQTDKLYYERQKQAWFLDAVDIYCSAVAGLTRDLSTVDLRSRGLLAFREYLVSYTKPDDFLLLVADTRKMKADLSGIRYSLHMEGKRIRVRRYDSEPDYGEEVLQTFEKFKQAAPKEYRFRFSSTPDMNHVEAAILGLVVQLYPEAFLSLDHYCARYGGYLDATIALFDREVQFYLACIEHMERLKTAGLPLCYPIVTEQRKEVSGRSVFDLALASRLVRDRMPVVTNDFCLNDPERIIVVSGPNQGGKTTFARTFGQLHYLASIGCPVPGYEAKLFHFDQLFTHFEKEEHIQTFSGKLEDELLRIHRIFERATANSVIIMNESFLSTTLSDALFLGEQIMQRIIALNLLCVSVTFLDELASLGPTTVSMMSTVDPKDPALRTFKVVRKPADGLAYAVAIAEKYHLSHGGVKQRIIRKVMGRSAS